MRARRVDKPGPRIARRGTRHRRARRSPDPQDLLRLGRGACGRRFIPGNDAAVEPSVGGAAGFGRVSPCVDGDGPAHRVAGDPLDRARRVRDGARGGVVRLDGLDREPGARRPVRRPVGRGVVGVGGRRRRVAGAQPLGHARDRHHAHHRADTRSRATQPVAGLVTLARRCGLFGFIWLELAYSTPASPRVIAIALTGYTVVMLGCAARFGRRWLQTGEAFTVLFGLVACIAPIGRREDGRLALRTPFTGLATLVPRRGTVAAVLVVSGRHHVRRGEPNPLVG